MASVLAFVNYFGDDLTGAGRAGHKAGMMRRDGEAFEG